MLYEKMSSPLVCPLPLDLIPSIIQYLPIGVWPNILCLSKEARAVCEDRYRLEKARFVLKPYILRLKACYAVRKTFVHRLRTDLDYRLKYLYIHEPIDRPIHVCWRKVPPKCLSVFKGLENIQRLLVGEIAMVTNLLRHIRPDQYEFFLRTMRIE